MNRLENRLRESLKCEDPSAGFAERVLARAQETNQHSWTILFARRSLRWGLSGAFCLALVVSGMELQKMQMKKAQSEAAKQQLILALQIASEQLQFVQSKIIQP
jgi:hypothetical protein